jgi:hypothetical protein
MTFPDAGWIVTETVVVLTHGRHDVLIFRACRRRDTSLLSPRSLIHWDNRYA